MFQNLTPVTKNLLIANIVLFIISQLYQPLYQYFAVFYFDSPNFKIWQLVTHMFMHASIPHIFFNMFSLVMFGPMIEQVLGQKKFLNFYFICGLGACLLQMGVQALELYNVTGAVMPLHSNVDLSQWSGDKLQFAQEIYRTPMVGASGAIYGILLAFAYLFPNLPLQFLFIPVPVKAKYMIGGFILIELYLSLSNPGGSIAHMAHVGGALFAYITLKIWRIRKGIY